MSKQPQVIASVRDIKRRGGHVSKVFSPLGIVPADVDVSKILGEMQRSLPESKCIVMPDLPVLATIEDAKTCVAGIKAKAGAGAKKPGDKVAALLSKLSPADRAKIAAQLGITSDKVDSVAATAPPKAPKAPKTPKSETASTSTSKGKGK